MNRPPTAQLLVEPVERKSNLPPLPRRYLQHFRAGHVHTLHFHQPGHGRAFKGGDQTQGRDDSRRADGASGPQLGGIDPGQDRQGIRIVGGCAGLPGQWLNDVAAFIEIIRNHHHTPTGLKLGQFDPGNRFALGHAHSQGVRQHAFDRGGFNHRRKFNVPFDPRQIERQQIVPRLDARPLAQLRNWNRAVGLNVEVANRERFVLENELVKRPDASAPEQIKGGDRAD